MLLGAARERDDWDETLALLGALGLEAPFLRQLEENYGRFGWKARIAYVVVMDLSYPLHVSRNREANAANRSLSRAETSGEVLGETK